MKSIIGNYKNNIQKVIRNITGQNNEDIEQEVYIRTWQNLEKYQENGKFKSWISTITANICRDYMRSASYKNNQITDCDETELLNAKDDKNNIENQLATKQRQKRITEAINSLKPTLKNVVVMYEIEDLSYEDISIALKIPVGTVKSRLFKARKELAIILKDLI